MSEANGHDIYLLGFHEIPSDAQLRALSYVALCDLLSSCEAGTAQFMVVEAEKRRRDVSGPEPAKAKPDHATNPTANVSDKPKYWAQKFLGQVFVGVVVVVLAAIAIYLLKQHSGLPL